MVRYHSQFQERDEYGQCSDYFVSLPLIERASILEQKCYVFKLDSLEFRMMAFMTLRAKVSVSNMVASEHFR